MMICKNTEKMIITLFNGNVVDLAVASGSPQSLEIMGKLENHVKCSMHGKIVEF